MTAYWAVVLVVGCLAFGVMVGVMVRDGSDARLIREANTRAERAEAYAERCRRAVRSTDRLNTDLIVELAARKACADCSPNAAFERAVDQAVELSYSGQSADLRPVQS